jgi:iron complex transport system ATP-binding protein
MCCSKREGTMLSLQNISYRIGKKNILQEINAVFKRGELNIILGPNGSGKSSLLKIISGDIKAYSGTVLYDQKDSRTIKTADWAKNRSVMSQQPELSFPLIVEEVVMMGRYPHFAFNPGKKDEAICRQVMERLQLQSFSERNYLTLSGGEKQRVQFARVLAQIWEPTADSSRYLFLDEPIASLDIYYQHQFLQMVKQLLADNITVVAVLHDINLSIQYGSNIVFMKEGRLITSGRSAETITAGLIHEIFNIPVKVLHNSETQRPIIVYDQAD